MGNSSWHLVSLATKPKRNPSDFGPSPQDPHKMHPMPDQSTAQAQEASNAKIADCVLEHPQEQGTYRFRFMVTKSNRQERLSDDQRYPWRDLGHLGICGNLDHGGLPIGSGKESITSQASCLAFFVSCGRQTECQPKQRLMMLSCWN